MKKLLAFILAAVMVLGLAACGNGGSPEPAGSGSLLLPRAVPPDFQ